MAIRYEYDLYPRTAPKVGARILRFTQLQLAQYFHQRNGTGSGQIALRADESDGDAIDPAGLQYVRVRRVNDAVIDGATLSGFSELVVGGMFLETSDFLAIDVDQQRLLTTGGAGTLSYLDRARMWSHSYLDMTSVAGNDPRDGGLWALWNQGPIAGGDFLGAVLWRVITEALSFRSGATYTHRHPDGIEYTDAHDDDRTATAIPDVTMTFTAFLDSSGNAWSVPSGEFTAMVGDSVLEVTKRLMEAGLYVELDPDTFELNAWEIANHGRDRTGVAWGADVVRFVPPTDQQQANGNVLNDLKRAQDAKIRRTKMLAGGLDDIYGDADGAGDVKWEGYYPSDVAHQAALETIAARQIGARNDAGDTVRVRIHVDNAPASGSYLPGEHVQVDDMVTLHTGTDPWDWNEAEYPVAQWGITTRRAGDTDAFVDLGAMYFATGDRRFQVPGVGRPNPRPCDPGIACANLTASHLTASTATNGDAENAAGGQWSGGGYQTVDSHGGTQSYGILSATTIDLAYAWDSAQVFSRNVRYVVDVWARQDGGHVSKLISFGKPGVDEHFDAHNLVAAPGGWNLWRICFTPSADRTGVVFRWQETQAPADLFLLDDLVLYITDNDEYAGDSPRVSRCGHRHHARDIPLRPPPGMTATNVQAGFDGMKGLIGSGDHGALSGLDDDDHKQYELTTEGGQGKVQAHGAMGAAETFDPSDGNVHTATLDASCTITLGAPPATRDGSPSYCLLELVFTGVGTNTWTWPAAVTWDTADGNPPDSPGDGELVRVIVETWDGGTAWRGAVVGGGTGAAAPATIYVPLAVDDGAGGWHDVFTADGKHVMIPVEAP